MSPEAFKDRALSMLALAGIATLVAGLLIGGAVLYSQWSTGASVESQDAMPYMDRTPVTPEVAEEIRIQERAAAEWTAAREKERLENESRDGTHSD